MFEFSVHSFYEFSFQTLHEIAMTVVHEEPITVRYSDYGDQCTLVVYIVFLVVTIVVPFIIVLFTGGMKSHD